MALTVCPHCQSDLSAEIDGDFVLVECPVCGQPLEDFSEPEERLTPFASSADSSEEGESPFAEGAVLTDAPAAAVAAAPAVRAPVATGAAAAPVGGSNAVQAPVDDEPETLFEKKKLPESEMDMTPMVDVTFLLLIFFMVTAAFSPQKVLSVPNPREDEEASSQQIEQQDEDPDVIRVFVDQYNTYLVIAPDGEYEAPSRLELINRLRDTQNFDPPPSKAMIIAHPAARHDKVVQALDAAVVAGLTKRLLSVSEEMFDD